ncbi:hypothetical protein N9Q68_01635 [Polaribacter sp.]|nr:hypothetical protein [Polaribacter sp.]
MTTTISDKKHEVNDHRTEIYNSFKNRAKRSSISEIIFGIGVGDAQDELNESYKRSLAKHKSINSLFFSEEFNHLYWFKNSIFVEANKTSSPIFTSDADLILAEKDTIFKAVNISTKIDIKDQGVYTFSVYAKKGNSNTVLLRLGEIDQRAVFNLHEGETLYTKNVINAGMEKLVDGWYRCFVTVNLKQNGLALIGITNNKGAYVYKNKTQKSLYLWGGAVRAWTVNYL